MELIYTDKRYPFTSNVPIKKRILTVIVQKMMYHHHVQRYLYYKVQSYSLYNRSIKYLGASITSNRNLKEEVQIQTIEAAMMSGYLCDIICNQENRYLKS
jgi:hypothetical protein